MRPATSESEWVIDGERVTMPVEVRSAKMVAATFLVDPDAAQRVIDYTGLHIARQPGGKAVCTLSAVQYLDNDLGPYNEIAVAFVVRPHDLAAGSDPPSFLSGKVTTFIHKLPVNQVFTCHAGLGIWGFPKWVTDITYTDRGRHTEAVLLDGGEFVLALDARRGLLPLPGQEAEMACYSFCDGVLRRTRWTTRNRHVTATAGGTRLELGTHHPMADELRSLGLPKRAAMTMTAGIMQASFGPPETVA